MPLSMHVRVPRLIKLGHSHRGANVRSAGRSRSSPLSTLALVSGARAVRALVVKGAAEFTLGKIT